MIVSDRVMGNCWASYDPCAAIDEPIFDVSNIQQPSNMEELQQQHNSIYDGQQIEEPTREDIQDWVMQSRGDRFRELCDVNEFQRLHKALLDEFGFKDPNQS